MDATMALKIAGLGLPILAAGSFVFYSVRWKLPSVMKTVGEIKGNYVKKSELYEDSGETKYQPVTRCEKNQAACQELIHKEIRSIGVSISNLSEGHQFMKDELAKVDKRTALMSQRLDDFIKYHTEKP